METLFKLLQNSFIIDRITIHNFTVLDENINIEIDIISGNFGNRKILFSEVQKLNVDPQYYGSSETSSIIIEDVSELQWEGIFYKIMISDDTMVFYCRNIELK